MKFAQRSVGFDIPIVANRRVTNEFIGANETPETVPVHRARRHVLGFVDKDARKGAKPRQQVLQTFKQLLIREVSMATRNNREGLCKLLQRDNRLKCTLAPNPYFRRVLDSFPLELGRPSVV